MSMFNGGNFYNAIRILSGTNLPVKFVEYLGVFSTINSNEVWASLYDGATE